MTIQRAAPIAAFVSAIAITACFLALSSADSGTTLYRFFTRPFSSWWHIGNMLNLFSLLLCAALGSAISLTSGEYNLGGEAQIYAPALVTAVMLAPHSPLSFLPLPLQLMAALCLSCLSGALLAAIPAILSVTRGISALLTSFLLSAASLPVLDYLVGGPLRDQAKNLLATEAIVQGARLRPFLAPSYLNASFPLILALSVSLAVYLHTSRGGYRLGITGTAPEFARFSGFAVSRIKIAAMSASGALHGLTGFFAVTGTWYLCHQGMSGGMGWSALTIALIAGKNIGAVVPAALLFAWLETATDTALLSTQFSFDSTALIQAVVLLLISARTLPHLRRGRKKEWK